MSNCSVSELVLEPAAQLLSFDETGHPRGMTSSPRLRRKTGFERLAWLLDELRALRELSEREPGKFRIGSRPFLHFHFQPDGEIVADVHLGGRGISEFDVSDREGQAELLAAIESHLGY